MLILVLSYPIYTLFPYTTLFRSKLCEEVLERPELSADPRYTTSRARVLNRETLIPALEESFRRNTTEAWRESLRRAGVPARSEEHTSELQSRGHIVCRLLLEKKK